MDCLYTNLDQDDGLPALICHSCLQQAELAFQFRRQCEQADVALRQFLGIGSNFNYKERGTNGYATADGTSSKSGSSDWSQSCNAEDGDTSRLRLKLNGEEILVEERDIASVLVVVDPRVPDYDANEKLSEKRRVSVARHGRQFQCGTCSKRFSQKAHLTRHELVHSGKKPFPCTACSKSFADASTLTTHYRTHSGERPYACDSCPKAFVSRSDLRKHSLVHSGLRPFACGVCSKTFTRATNLRKHARVHSGQRPYSCEQCARTFSSKGDLARHVLIHSGHRPHVCLVCCVSFSRRDKLVRHMRRHQPSEALLGQHLGEFARLANSLEVKQAKEPTRPEHRCATCGKVFQQLRELARHVKVHTGDKPFACELCPMRFSRRDKLARHSKVHGVRGPEARLLRCEHCTASYYRRDKLLRHQRTHVPTDRPAAPCRA
ncbi:zinc finger protein OZF-like isoform X3 [Bacillus rossius redtenbacheri]|uniref:zinc finger protein OZF-like isoform X3 n=1 Tax=Bacillus rossius redtenbacheri TaxID=93214 RepID=UPI002FDE3BB0